MEEPRQPHRPPEAQALKHPADQQAPVPRLPPRPAALTDLPRQRPRRARAARSVAEVGQTISPEAVPKARAPDHRTARKGRSGVHEWTLKRPGRADQHPDPADHPTRLRLPLTTRRDRTRDALTRRASAHPYQDGD